MSDVLDINAYNNSENDASYKVASSSILILSEQPQLQEQNQVKSCHEMETLFSGLNNFFRDEDILKESEHSSELLGNLIFTAYLLVIAFGSFGNLLTIMAVLRNKQMRTVRNFFILNLALSDFFVCTVTAPTTLYTVLYVFWPFTRPLCKIAGSLQGFNIFLSTFSITAIALDRYVLVIFPTKQQRQQNLSIIFFSLIWLASILLAAPLFLAADISPIFHDVQCGIELKLCNEQNERWRELLLSKEAYTGGVIILQYLLPLASIAFAYSRIARRMGARKSCRCGSGGGVDSRKNSVYLNTPVFSNRSSLCRQIAAGGATSPFSASDNGHQNSKLVIFTNDETNCNLLQNVNPSAEILLNQRRKSIAVRHRRTNMLLVTLVVVFACAWLPLNIFHAYTLLFNKFSKTASFSVPIFALCHLTAMCSACLNPCCYAFFNNNFRQEFIAMYRKLGLITFYRRLVNFTKILRPNSEINKNGSVNATQINRNKELGTTPSTENEENQHLQQMTQGVLKNSEETSSRPLYEALNEKMVKIPKLEPCESGRRERKVSILAETIRMNCY